MGSQIRWRIVIGVMILVILSIISPFLLTAFHLNFTFSINNINLFTDTVERTIFYSVISSVLLTAVGFWGAVALRTVPFFSGLGKNLSVLILPAVLGNISIAFICKLLIGDSAFFADIVQKGGLYKLLFLMLLQIWQYGLLFVYMFWLQFQSIPLKWFDYARAANFSFSQKIKDIYLPQTRDLSILLLLLGFIFSLFEESKISYLFKVSQGTNSELITNWLARNYQSTLLINPGYAENMVFTAGMEVFVIATITFILLFLIAGIFFKGIAKAKIYRSLKEHKQSFISFNSSLNSRTFALVLSLLVIVPVIWAMFSLPFSIGNNLFELGFPLMMTLLAAILSAVIAIIFGIASRLGWRQKLSTFNNRSLPFFILLFLLMLIPPIIILLCGYKWMSRIGYGSDTVIYLVWMIGHVILTLPILGSFALFNHFRVSTNELNYIEVFKLKTKEVIKLSFLSRFKAEYLLLFIIGYSFIWNEAILNNLFSDYIPSFASGLKMLITGRGADYSKAFGYLLVSVSLAFLSVLLWRGILEKAQKNTEIK
jgi:ABC-type sugar transport system permease subunit